MEKVIKGAKKFFCKETDTPKQRRHRFKQVVSLLLVVAVLGTSVDLSAVKTDAGTTYNGTKSGSGLWQIHCGGSDNEFHRHAINGTFAYCAWRQGGSSNGKYKKIKPSQHPHTEWMTKKTKGYQRWKYCAIVKAYAVDKNITLDGVYHAKKLLNLSKKKREALTACFVWYMQNNMSYGAYITNIDGWSKKDQIKLFDSLYKAAYKKLGEAGVTTEYSLYKKVKGGDSQQPLLLLSAKQVVTPTYKDVSYSDYGTNYTDVTINLDKRDTESDVGLAGAEFEFSCDGKVVGTATTDAEGKVEYVYSREEKTQNFTVTKTYCSNYNALTSELKKQVTARGYYQDYSKAYAAAKAEVTTKKNNAVKALKAKEHTWTVKETKAPFGHKLSNPQTQTLTELSNKKKLSVTFNDNPFTVGFNIKKVSSANSKKVLKGAVYGLYAKEDILKTDNKTVAYKAGELVTTLTTGADGTASASDLYPGVYYLQEIEAPTGYKLSEEQTTIDLTKETEKEISRALSDEPYLGVIKLTKTYGDDKKPEVGAEFEVQDEDGKVYDTITTGEDGVAESNVWLPYGTYILKQTKKTEGYSVMPDMVIKIDKEEDTVYEYSWNDIPEYTGLQLLKKKVFKDEETNTDIYDNEAEAVFEVIDKDGNVVDTLTTDKNGYAKSKKLPAGKYTVHQVSGDGAYELVADQDITLEEGHLSTYLPENEGKPNKIRIKKTKTKNDETVKEADAVFKVLDANKISELSSKDLESAESRQAFVEKNADAVVATLTTNKKGEAVEVLTELDAGHDFIVLQVSGAKGYALADPFYSAKEKGTKEGNVTVYEFTADDEIVDWGKIEVTKKKVVARAGEEEITEAESNAEFEIRDASGNVVDTLTTDKDGKDTSVKLEYGTYILHQTSGDKSHRYMDDVKFTIDENYHQKTYEYEGVDTEKTINFELTKTSKETGIVVDGAVYEVYNEKGESVATFTTDEKGVGTCNLPYGKYTLHEATPKDGYKTSENQEFEIKFSAVTYDEKTGNGTFQLTDQDEPVYGIIKINKTGEVLTGIVDSEYDTTGEYFEGRRTFSYEARNLAGAVYELYAKEDIKLDDGSVLYKAGTLIDTKTTDEDGNITFTRQWKGETTEKFPQGIYYYKEKEAPEGYVLDTEEHEVVINWDRKAEEMNDTEDKEPEDDGKEAERPEASTGKYVLEQGLNAEFDKAETSVTFTWETAPTDATTTDVSADKDGSVVMWEVNNEAYISTQTAGQCVIFNARSEEMFKGLSQCTTFDFNNADVSQVVDATSMFEGCSSVTELDLSDWNTVNFMFVSKMFYNCTSLETIYAADTELIDVQKKSTGIKITANHKFLEGNPYNVEDFTYTILYDDGSEEVIADLPSNIVTMNPTVASPLGTVPVDFTFSENPEKYVSSYEKEADGSWWTADTVVTADTEVVDHLDVPDTKVEDIVKENEEEDALKKLKIRVEKEDENGDMVEGATFTLYATTDIKDADGNVLVQAGKAISTGVSEVGGNENAEFTYVEFGALPSNLYAAVKGSTEDMFRVQEKIPAPGYKLNSSTTYTFNGILEGNGNNPLILHTFKEDNEDTEGETRIYDSGTVVNDIIHYVSIHKIWMDSGDSECMRPDTLKVVLTKKSDSSQTKTYTLKASENWTCVTDIPESELNDWEFEEDLGKDLADFYTETESAETVNKAPCHRITNELSPTVTRDVQKLWDDNDNNDGIRPDSIQVALYQNGELITQNANGEAFPQGNPATLNDTNSWYTKWETLPRLDDNSEPYVYTVKELDWKNLTGEIKEGYKSTIKSNK